LAIDVEIFGQLLPGQPRRRTMETKGLTTARDIAHTIGLDLADIGLVAIDGVQSHIDDAVQPDSRLCFFPYMSGG
jgi:hypothetical protein